MRALAVVAAVAVAAALVTGGGLVNYDTAYALVWGEDLASGRAPDLGAELAPTPHPLANVLAMLLAPLPATTALQVTLAAGFAALGALAYVTYALGARWFGPAAGVAVAAVVLTRRPVLDFGARAYVDIPYLVLVLAALLLATRGRRLAPLAPLTAAGLLRPEAWLLAGLYALWLRDRRALALAAAAPLLWALHDLLAAGDPLYSFTGTRENAAELQRVTGLDDVPLTAPRRVGEILREPVLLAVLLAAPLLWRRRDEPHVRLLAATGVAAFAAFCVLAAAGLPILGRYLLLVAVLLALAAGAVATGPRWAVAVVAVALAAGVPSQVDRLAGLRRALERQSLIQDDLRAALTASRPCTPVTIPNHRARPLVALWLGVRPTQVANAQDEQPPAGTWATPATPQVARDYVLDPRDLDRRVLPAPAGYAPAASNRSWRVSSRCPTTARKSSARSRSSPSASRRRPIPSATASTSAGSASSPAAVSAARATSS